MTSTADDLVKHCIYEVQRRVQECYGVSLDGEEKINVYTNIALSLLNHVFECADCSENEIIDNCKKIAAFLILKRMENDICSSSSQH